MRLTTAVAVTAAAFAAAVGCGGTTGPDRGLVVTTAIAPAEFRAGTAVTVSLTVENVGNRTHSIDPRPCPDPFTVTAAAGTVFASPDRVCDLSVVIPQPLGPGERVVLTREWRGDVGGGGPSIGGGVPLAAGEYRLRGRVQTSDDDRVHEGSTVGFRVLP